MALVVIGSGWSRDDERRFQLVVLSLGANEKFAMEEPFPLDFG